MACADVLLIPRTEAYSRRQADQFSQLRTESQWTDVTINSHGTTFQCHRVLLAATSPVLKAMMLADMAESNERTIKLDDIPPTVLELLINYIYTGEACVPNDQLISATKAADFLQIPEVKEYCLCRAVTVLSPSNVVSWFKLGDSLHADELKSKCSAMLASSLSDVCKESEFLELSLAEMSSYMSDARDSEVDCDDLLAAILGWVDHKADARQEHLMGLVQNITLCRCSVECLEEMIDTHTSLLRSQPDALILLTKGIVEVAKQPTVRKKQNKRGNTKTSLAVIGGHQSSGEPNKTFWYLEPSLQFVDLCELEVCAPWLSVCVTPDGFVVTGGRDSVLCMMFVSSTRSWKKLKCLNNPRHYHGSVFRNGRIYVLGGWVSWEKSASVQSLDLAKDKWEDEPDLPIPVEHPEVACLDGSIFLLDIDNGELLHLDMDARSWRQQSQRPGGGCFEARMVAVRGQLMIIGGDGQLFDCYSPESGTWTTRRKPTMKHQFAGVAFHDQKLYLIGGDNEDHVEEYSFDSESWAVCDYRVPKKLEHLHAVVLDI